MSYTTILTDVKCQLGITGTFQDNTIQGYIDEVKQFMLEGGVAESVVNSIIAKGVITRGVSDLWNYGSGGTTFSPYFFQRVTQLALKVSGSTPEEISAMEARLTALEARVDTHDELFETLAGEEDE